MLSLFGFGKKHKTYRKVTKARKHVIKARKPPTKVLKMCKKLKVKATLKRGSKRVYKSTRILVKQCMKKLRMMKKHKLSTRRKMSTRRKTSRVGKHFRFGSCGSDKMMLEFGASKKIKFGRHAAGKAMEFGASKKIKFGRHAAGKAMEFGKRPKTHKSMKKVSKANAMAAFKKFYRRHCHAIGRTRFGGNPPLYQSMGYEFCPLGQGGVLGANSTGLFPSPCYAYNAKEAASEKSVVLPARYGAGDINPTTGKKVMFGKKRRSRKAGVRRRAVSPVRRRTMAGHHYKM
jgi:hypothetical protein